MRGSISSLLSSLSSPLLLIIITDGVRNVVPQVLPIDEVKRLHVRYSVLALLHSFPTPNGKYSSVLSVCIRQAPSD
jgi:hypothetical protein